MSAVSGGSESANEADARNLREAVEDAVGAASTVKGLMRSAAGHLEKGDVEEARPQLASILTTLGLMTGLNVELQRHAGERAAEMFGGGKDLVEVQTRWVDLLGDFKASLAASDFVKAADILAFDMSEAVDRHAVCLQTLSQGIG